MLGGFVMEKQNKDEIEKQDGKDQNIDLTILNETAKAAKMGLESIHYLEEKISNSKMKKQLSDQYTDYSQIVDRVNEQFKQYGEIPDPAPIKTKMMSYMGIQMNTMTDQSPSHIAELLMQGNYMGIIECQKLLNHNPYAKDEVKNILTDFQKLQENNIQTMKEFL